MDPAIETCLRADTIVPERRRVADGWPRWREGSACAPTTAAQALLGGFDADRVGRAFAAGYQAALRALLPGLPSGAVTALCVTEEAGVLWARAADEPTAQRWQRDVALFNVASSAAGRRATRAWQALQSAAPS